MTHLIKVTNTGTTEISDYFDGLCYTFAPDKPINVPLNAMRHIFGVDFPDDEQVLKSISFRDEAFQSVSRRWGWNAHDKNVLAQNRKAFNALVFTPIIMRSVEIVASSNEMPEPREQKVAKEAKASKFKPRADEEGTSEEEVG